MTHSEYITVNIGDIFIKKKINLKYILNKIFFWKKKRNYIIGIALCQFVDNYNNATIWFTPRKQYSNQEKLNMIRMLAQMPPSMNIDDLIYVLVNTIRPNTFNSLNFTSFLDLYNNQYYRKL